MSISLCGRQNLFRCHFMFCIQGPAIAADKRQINRRKGSFYLMLIFLHVIEIDHYAQNFALGSSKGCNEHQYAKLLVLGKISRVKQRDSTGFTLPFPMGQVNIEVLKSDLICCSSPNSRTGGAVY